eukprot:2547912-Amphidinium_carterae.1
MGQWPDFSAWHISCVPVARVSPKLRDSSHLPLCRFSAKSHAQCTSNTLSNNSSHCGLTQMPHFSVSSEDGAI